MATRWPVKAQARTTLFMGIANDQLNGRFNTVYGFRDNIPGATDAPSYAHGQGNTLVGANASNYTNGSDNTAVGFNAGGWFLSGSQNVFIGSGSSAQFGGSDSPTSNTRIMTGNSFVGFGAGYSNRGDYNVFMGHQAGYSNVMGRNNVFLGANTGYANTEGSNNIFLGYQAGQANKTGANNTFVGWLSGQANTTGQTNVFVGGYTGHNNTTGQLNTFLGYATGWSNTTGRVNTFLGGYAGESNTTGIQNTLVGYLAGRGVTTGNNNTMMGYQAGQNVTTGSNNIIIGVKSGTAVTEGSDNILMGFNSQSEDGLQNAIAIGANSRVAASNALILGNQVNVGIGTSAPTNRLEVISQSPNTSGLTLKNLTAASPATQTTDQFLTVNEKGDVVKARYQLRISRPSEWSDQVFSSSYPLRSLSSVASYIDQHGHLPGVPSAEHVVKDGVDLVKMQATLLEKIEELTLYSIEQDKKIEDQQARIDLLEKQHQQEMAALKQLLKQLLHKK